MSVEPCTTHDLIDQPTLGPHPERWSATEHSRAAGSGVDEMVLLAPADDGFVVTGVRRSGTGSPVPGEDRAVLRR